MSDAPPHPTPPSRFDRDMALKWTLVFLINLPLPVLFALAATRRNGALGLIAGLVVLYWIGLVVCAARFRVGRSLIWGGIMVGVSQPVPLLHYGAGALGLFVWEHMTGYPLDRQTVTTPPTPTPISNSTPPQPPPAPPPERETMNNLGVFVVVLLTAQPLWVIAILAGAFFRWSFSDSPIWRNPPADPDADPDLTENPAS